jgi:hypothetical protein
MEPEGAQAQKMGGGGWGLVFGQEVFGRLITVDSGKCGQKAS